MKVKRMVKRLFAVGTGVAMLGATAMGALAADLGSYPGMFVDEGKFNGFFVVGENAASVDNLAMTDIAASMKYNAPSGTTVTSVLGDAWLVKSGSDVMEFGESIGPATNGVVDFLDSDDLAALADGSLTSSQGTFTYEQFLHFDEAWINTTYGEDDDDNTDLFLKIPDGKLFARYELNFLDAAESDIDVSDSFELEDYEEKQFNFFGKTYTMVKAITGGAHSDKVTLTLMAGSSTGTLQEGESMTYKVGDKDYTVDLAFTDSSSRAKFVINGQSTNLMDKGDTETLADGSVFGLTDVLYQDYAGGIHSADFFLGADKLVLEDDSIITAGSTDELQVNDEVIDGADVEIVGAILTNATATTDGELEIDTITINMTSQDDYFIAVGETLLGQAELDEKDLVFSQNWDIRFDGLDASVATDRIKLYDKSGEKEYWLEFTNINGDVIDMPFVYAEPSGTNLRLGDQDDNLSFHNTALADETYFILNDDTDEDSVTTVLQYKGADKFGTSDPKVKFKNLATGETISRPVSFGQTPMATLKISGTTYNIQNVTGVNGATGADDYQLIVSGGSATNTTLGNLTATLNNANYLIANGGAKIYLLASGNQSAPATTAGYTTATGGIQFNVSLIDSDRVDDLVTAPYDVVTANITAASGELDLASVTGGTRVTFVSPDDDDDNQYAYAANGAFIRHYTPSGSGTTADTLTLDWPQVEKTATVYVTSGAVSTSTSSASGNLMAVEIVDATKLDSEVASTTAQNVIAVGGPCVNTVAAELLGNPADCTEGFTPGKARVKLFEHANGNVAMLVAGYSGADTRLAGKVIAHRWTELTGSEVEVEGTTYSDATVGAPAPMVVAAPVVEEVSEQ